MIYFNDIFQRAFNLFDDPDISRKYYYDPAGFQQDMLEYLINGKNKFTYPTAITDKLTSVDEAEGNLEVFTPPIDSSLTEVTYTLSTTPHIESVFTYRIDSELVPGSYDAETNSVTFYKINTLAQSYSVEWYYAGAFTASFTDCFRSDFPINSIMEKIINILAYALLSAWGDKEVGRVLEVRNILTDNDFKMYSPANSANAKVAWRNQMNRDMDTLISELNWRILSEPRGGSRFGK